jgi:hypothetical protein
MDRIERRRIERRIAKCDRRLARGIDLRHEAMGGAISETGIKEYLEAVLAHRS